MSRRDEVTALLQALLRLDTVNPPGNETQAAELLRDYLAQNGIECELFARVPTARTSSRGSRAATGRRSRSSPTRTPCSPIPPSGIAIPWSGDLVDGEVWGRGALDMKDQVAASAVAFASLAREGFEPSGDLVFIVVADEEVGGDDGYGLDLALRGASRRRPLRLRDQRGRRASGSSSAARPVYLCATAEKMSAPFNVRVHGRSGHASMPGIARQRARQGGALPRGARRVRAASRADPGGEGPARGDARRGAAARGGARPSARARPDARRSRRAAARVHALADDDRRVAPAERHPGALRDHGRLPAAAGDDAGGRRAADPRRARERPLRPRVPRGGRRDALAARDATLGRARASSRRRSSRARGWRRWPAPASPTATSCARRSARSRTGTSRSEHMDTELATKLVHSANERIPVDDLELGVEMLRSVAHSLLAS